ncbi:hypothetical protein NQ314_008072 [Rhamnusium bicolor]|uniref:DDE Tnp4 domain-containing protein n=1 Tax=Rhamnusium bicolor TaxID=1586634 RepID=A0AAV8YED1_9CUCU|nr:hypothetical protein NQ314_008072 [Rhamnusium bicolor]
MNINQIVGAVTGVITTQGEQNTTFLLNNDEDADIIERIVDLIAHLPEFMKREYGGKDQTGKVLLIVLWTLATPSSYRSIGNQFNVCKYSVLICLHKVVKVIVNHLCRRFITWPSPNEINLVANGFSRYGMEKVIGVVDGCHIAIKKTCHSCDVDVRWPGSVHDDRVFRTSEIYPFGSALCEPDYYILGDAAYPCKNCVMTPYTNNSHLTQTQV